MNALLAQVQTSRLTKIGPNRTELPIEAAGHLAVYDARTELYHAVNVCPKELSRSQAKKLAEKLNAEKYAGIDTWHVPGRHDAFSIVKPGAYGPAADTDFFPDMQSYWYWTDEVHPADSSCVFAVGFLYGDVYGLPRALRAFCRPVASVSPRQ